MDAFLWYAVELGLRRATDRLTNQLIAGRKMPVEVDRNSEDLAIDHGQDRNSEDLAVDHGQDRNSEDLAVDHGQANMRSPANLGIVDKVSIDEDNYEDDGPSTSAQAAEPRSQQRRHADLPMMQEAATTKRRHLNSPKDTTFNSPKDSTFNLPEDAAFNLPENEILPDFVGLREVVARLTPQDKVVVLTFDEIFTKPETTYSGAEDMGVATMKKEKQAKYIAELKNNYLKDENLAKCNFWLNKGVFPLIVVSFSRYTKDVIAFYDNITPSSLKWAIDAKTTGGPKITKCFMTFQKEFWTTSTTDGDYEVIQKFNYKVEEQADNTQERTPKHRKYFRLLTGYGWFIDGFQESAQLAGCCVNIQNIALNPWRIIGGIATSICKQSEIILPYNAKDGDNLVLTKPLGIQLATNAYIWFNDKNEKYHKLAEHFSDQIIFQTFEMALKSMTFLNRDDKYPLI
uniref:Uncharacterized protein n=1 Tax=Glossina palpalis gambiensis TaxID=67801 RepID=A0A1B0AM70_9MUSC